MKVIFSTLVLIALTLTACGEAGDRAEARTAETPSASASASAGAAATNTGTPDAPRKLTWDDLMPVGESKILKELMQEHMARVSDIREGSAKDEMVQIGTFNVVESLDGQHVRIPGYVIPFNFNKTNEYSEFLLVPYAGACIHAPPPPPNQIVYVKADKPVKVESIWDAVWVEGGLKTQKHEDALSDAAYTLTLTSLEAYQ